MYALLAATAAVGTPWAANRVVNQYVIVNVTRVPLFTPDDMLSLPGGMVIARVAEVSGPQRGGEPGGMSRIQTLRVFRDAELVPLRWLRPHPGVKPKVGAPITVRYNTDDIVGGLKIDRDETLSLETGQIVLVALSDDMDTPQEGPPHLEIRTGALGCFHFDPTTNEAVRRMDGRRWRLRDVLNTIDRLSSDDARRTQTILRHRPAGYRLPGKPE
jgi:hypothetical protein